MGMRLSTKWTEEVPIFIDTIPSLNFKLALLVRRKCSPKFKSCDRFLTTIGAIRMGCSIFSIYIKKGLALPTISTGWPATAVPAFKEHGETGNFSCFAKFSEQMVPNKFPLSIRFLINVFPINVRVYPKGICFVQFKLLTYWWSSKTLAWFIKNGRYLFLLPC